MAAKGKPVTTHQFLRFRRRVLRKSGSRDILKKDERPSCICPSKLLYSASALSVEPAEKTKGDKNGLTPMDTKYEEEFLREQYLRSVRKVASALRKEGSGASLITRTSGAVCLIGDSYEEVAELGGGLLCNRCMSSIKNDAEEGGKEGQKEAAEYIGVGNGLDLTGLAGCGLTGSCLGVTRTLHRSKSYDPAALSKAKWRVMEGSMSRNQEVTCDLIKTYATSQVGEFLNGMDSIGLDGSMFTFSMREDGIALQKGVPLSNEYSKDTIIKFQKRHYVIFNKDQEPVKSMWSGLKKLCFFHFLVR